MSDKNLPSTHQTLHSFALTVPQVNPAAMALTPGRLFAGRYQIEKLSAVGSVSAIFRATDNTTGKPVALKVLNPDAFRTTEAERGFGIGAELLRKLDHPGIAKVLDAVSAEGLFVLVYPFIEGTSLRQLITVRREKGLTFAFDEVRPILELISEALTAVRDRTAHGHIAPSNVLITPDAIQITDFRFDLVLPQVAHLKSARRGKDLPYIAPELRSAIEPPTEASDVYSLAVILLEMLTGVVYAGDPHVSPPDADKLNPTVNSAMSSIIRQALRTTPRHRPPTVLKFTGALVAAQDSGMNPLLDNVSIPSQSPPTSMSALAELDPDAVVEDSSLNQAVATNPATHLPIPSIPPPAPTAEPPAAPEATVARPAPTRPTPLSPPVAPEATIARPAPSRPPEPPKAVAPTPVPPSKPAIPSTAPQKAAAASKPVTAAPAPKPTPAATKPVAAPPLKSVPATAAPKPLTPPPVQRSSSSATLPLVLGATVAVAAVVLYLVVARDSSRRQPIPTPSSVTAPAAPSTPTPQPPPSLAEPTPTTTPPPAPAGEPPAAPPAAATATPTPPPAPTPTVAQPKASPATNASARTAPRAAEPPAAAAAETAPMPTGRKGENKAIGSAFDSWDSGSAAPAAQAAPPPTSAPAAAPSNAKKSKDPFADWEAQQAPSTPPAPAPAPAQPAAPAANKPAGKKAIGDAFNSWDSPPPQQTPPPPAKTTPTPAAPAKPASKKALADPNVWN
jgi:serine/threonine protein kinase